MAKAMPPANRPTYEQLEEIIKRKDNLLSGLFWKMEGLRAASWLGHHAVEGGNPGYSEGEYAAAACHLFRLLSEQTRTAYDEFKEAHHAVSQAVLAGLPEGEEVEHA